MSRIREQVAVPCPIAEAESRVERFFALRRGSDGTSRLELRITFDTKGPLEGLALEHDVLVTAVLAKDDQNLNNVIRIRWEPTAGAFPSFNGTIVAWAEHDPQTTFLELDGSYEPPGGSAGAFFDESIGNAIARQTARTLLRDIAENIGERPTSYAGETA